MSAPTYTLRITYDPHTHARRTVTLRADAASPGLTPGRWVDVYTARRDAVQHRLGCWGLDPQAALGAESESAHNAVQVCAVDAEIGRFGGGA